MIGEDVVREAIELHKAGLNMGEIVKRLHVSESGLSKRMLLLGYDLKEATRERREREKAERKEQIIELYATKGTLEIADMLGMRQSDVQAALVGYAGRRSRSEEIQANRSYRKERRNNGSLMICSVCGEEAVAHSTGVCGLCREDSDGETITERQALFELDSGWLSRNIGVYHR